jgi:hypothetical protein
VTGYHWFCTTGHLPSTRKLPTTKRADAIVKVDVS